MIKIIINGLEWTVCLVDKTHPKLADENGMPDAYGITVFRDCEIYIDCWLQEELFKQTTTHELVHALAFSYGEDLDRANEEDFCNFVGAHFDELKTLRKAVLKAL